MHPDRTSDHLFEFDPRYQALGNTTLLPMEAPSTVPHKQQHCFDVVIADLSYMHDARDVKDALETSRLLTRLHEPLKIIVLALENFHGLLKGEGLQEAAIKPHCRGRADLVVFAKMVAL